MLKFFFEMDASCNSYVLCLQLRHLVFDVSRFQEQSKDD